MEDTEVTSTAGELTDERMDELANGGGQGTNREIPMTDADAAARAAKTDPAASAQDTYELKIGDRTIKGTRDQVIKWAQMGYGYPQKAQQLNQDRQKLEQQRAEYEKQYKPYQEIDAWAKANPDKWNAIERMFQSNGQAPAAHDSRRSAGRRRKRRGPGRTCSAPAPGSEAPQRIHAADSRRTRAGRAKKCR
jgi:hypothetical protein